MNSRNVVILIVIGLVAGAFLAPPSPFIIDGGIYLDMARSMADHGALHIVTASAPEGAPALAKYLTHEINGKIYPQYPSGYAIVAAPFYKLFGVHGLMLLNAIGAGAAIWLTWRAASRLYDAETARLAAILFGLATFLLNYAFSIWPHTLALAVNLAAVNFAIDGTQETNARQRLLNFALAGVSIGAAINIRVDAILFAPIILIWLKIFARPADRLAPLAIFIGMIPGLLASAMLNEAKFGVFSPISYGPKYGLAGIGAYLHLMAVGGAALVLLWAVNITKLYLIARKKLGAVRLHLLLTVVVTVALLPFISLITEVLYGVWVLVVDLQAHTAYRQEGVEENAYGHLLYWGYPKKAFIQSLPYLPLILLPLAAFFRGRNIDVTALSLLAIAAPVVFYAQNQWHGGGSYNMRYFMPATPFVAMLAAAAYYRIVQAAGHPQRTHILAAIVAAALMFQGAQFLGASSERFFAPAALYPQWIIAGACVLTVAFFLRRPHSRRTARVALFTALSAFSYAGFVNLADEAGAVKTKNEQRAMAAAVADALPDDALVVTQLPVLLVDAEEKGVSIMIADRVSGDDALAAVSAYERAGRCVYFQNPMARDHVAPYLGDGAVDPEIRWVAPKRFDHDSQLAFYVLASQTAKCTV